VEERYYQTLKYMSCAILRATFTWLALKIPWLAANMAPAIRGVAFSNGGGVTIPPEAFSSLDRSNEPARPYIRGSGYA
jgi:hypothetical protein